MPTAPRPALAPPRTGPLAPVRCSSFFFFIFFSLFFFFFFFGFFFSFLHSQLRLPTRLARIDGLQFATSTDQGKAETSPRVETTTKLSSAALIEMEEKYAAHTYHPIPVVFDKVSGV